MTIANLSYLALVMNGCVEANMSHLFQIRHMSDHRIAMDGCMETHESSFSIKAHA